jgi:hypothetical protein
MGVKERGMTRYEAMTNKINANFERLTGLPVNSGEAKELRHEQANLLTARMALTIGEEQEIVEE